MGSEHNRLVLFMDLCDMVLLVCPRIDVTTLMQRSVIPLPIYDLNCVIINRGPHLSVCLTQLLPRYCMIWNELGTFHSF
jgi:hypothetical protein